MILNPGKCHCVVIGDNVVACTCKLATLETKFWNGVGSVPVWGNSPWIDGWIV